jgi:hypothetical protein
MKKFHLTPLLFLIALSFVFSGCGSIEDAHTLEAGTEVQGTGYSVHVPESDLLLVRNIPRSGFLSLRSPEGGMTGSYNVYPFELPTPPATLREALRLHWEREGNLLVLGEYRIISARAGTWHGSAAWFETGYIPPFSSHSGAVWAMCLVRRGSAYYLFSRSVPITGETPAEISRGADFVRQGLERFISGIEFTAQAG